MRRRAIGLIPVLWLGVVGEVSAQAGRLETAGRDLERAARDIGHVWTAPFRLDGDDVVPLFLLAEGVVVIAGLDEQVQDLLDAHGESIPLRMVGLAREPGPISKLGRSTVLFPLSGALYLAGLAADSRELRDAGIGCATANLANTFSRHGLARLIGRLRPRNGQGAFKVKLLAFGQWEMRSFPGGHGANVMSCATFWNHRFDLGIAEPILYGTAGAVALGRVLDGAHWTSDAAFGSLWGWAVGREVARRFAERDADDDAVAAAPRANRVYIGFQLSF